MPKKSDPPARLHVVIALLSITGILALWACAGGYQECFGLRDPGVMQSAQRFDALAALFSGLAFCGLVCSIIYQRADFNRSISLMEAEFEFKLP